MFLRANGYYLARVPEWMVDERNKDLANAHVAVATGRWGKEEFGEYYKSIAEACSQ